jgi:hypothetical protein
VTSAPAGPGGPVTVVYLGGFGRSGSTLVERFLGAAAGWTNVGELVDLARAVGPADERCGCGAAFSRCELWSQVGERAFGGWSTEVFDGLARLQRAAARQRHLPGLLREHRRAPVALRELRASYAAIYRAVADLTGARVVVDASKGPALAQALAGSDEIDLRLLNVVRDPRAVAWSWSRSVERPHATQAGAARMWRIPAHRSAVQWSALQLEVTAIDRLGHVPTARLRYEEFVADPVASLVAVARRLGVPLSADDLPRTTRGRVRLGASHGLSGNPGRFATGEVELRRDDRWTTGATRSDRAVVTALTLPMLRAYGYPLTQPATQPTAQPATQQRSHS